MSTHGMVQPTAAIDTGRGRIVVGFDGSPRSLAGVEWAAAEAVVRGSSLRLVTCFAVPAPVDFYGVGARQGQNLAEIVSRVRQRHPDLTVEADSTHLDPREALIAAAASADLLILGSSESAQAKSRLFGSIPTTAARRSSSPVIVVRGDRPQPVRQIVVGVDGSSAAATALDWACVEASMHGAELVIVHAWRAGGDLGNSMRVRELARADAQCIVDLALSRCRHRTSLHVRGRLIEGAPSTVLVEASRKADLLAVGSRGRSGFKTMLFGSVALFVSERADCPVAVTHPQVRLRDRRDEPSVDSARI